MHKQLKQPMKKLGAVLPAMSIALAVGLAVPQQAHALRDILFPYVTTEAGKFTFISILNDASVPGPEAAGLHFSYAMKPAPVVAKAGCQHFDSDVNTTLADMMIFEVNRKVIDPSGTTALFEGGTAGSVTSGPLAYPIAGHVGFLSVRQPEANDAYLFGWATVVDSANGLTWTYSSDFLTSGGALSGPTDYSLLDGSNRKFLSWYPQAIVPTSWYVLPLSTEAAMIPGGGGGIRRGLVTNVDHAFAGAPAGTPGATDLDEQFFSGGKNVAIRCLGFMNRADLLFAASDFSTAGGGWASIVAIAHTLPATDAVDPGGAYTAGPYLAYKIQSTTALGAIRTTVNREPAHN